MRSLTPGAPTCATYTIWPELDCRTPVPFTCTAAWCVGVAGRYPHPDAPRKLFPNVQLITAGMRRVDAAGIYSARRLLLSRVEVTDLSAPFKIERGLVKAPQITGHFMGGNLVVHLDTDANQSPAHTRVEMTLKGMQLEQMPHKAEPPPYEGSLLLQIQAQGRGDSLHALASGADG